jgi:Flp pilus assembly protein TadB
MFPKRHKVTGTHTIRSAERNPEQEGRIYARAWFNANMFFIPMAMVGVGDLLVALPAAAYFAVAAFTLIPIGVTRLL